MKKLFDWFEKIEPNKKPN